MLIGGLTCGNDAPAPTAGNVDATTAAGALGAEDVAPSASPLVTRPSLPVPATSDALMPFSARIFAAAGMAVPTDEFDAGAVVATAACVATGAAGAAAAFVSDAPAAAVASVSIFAIS